MELRVILKITSLWSMVDDFLILSGDGQPKHVQYGQCVCVTHVLKRTLVTCTNTTEYDGLANRIVLC